MKTATFEIKGEAKGKGRPIVTRNGTFTPRRTVEYENEVRLAYTTQCREYFEDYVIAQVKVYTQIPKSASKKKREQMLSGEIRPTKKPDIDNILKSIFDNLNGIAYKDDSCVVSVEATKIYSEIPRVKVRLISNET